MPKNKTKTNARIVDADTELDRTVLEMLQKENRQKAATYTGFGGLSYFPKTREKAIKEMDRNVRLMKAIVDYDKVKKRKHHSANDGSFIDKRRHL